MNKIDGKTFNAALREALKETYEAEFEEFINPPKRFLRKRILVAAASIAVLIIIAIPVRAVYLRYRESYHKDYTQIFLNNDDVHSDTVDSLEISYIPHGWIRTLETENSDRIIERLEKEESYIIIKKSTFNNDNVIAIDDSYGAPEILFRKNINYYLYTDNDYTLILFVNDFQYIVDSYKVEKSELIKVVYSIK